MIAAKILKKTELLELPVDLELPQGVLDLLNDRMRRIRSRLSEHAYAIEGSGTPVVLTGTHFERVNTYLAKKYALNTLFWETDRKLLYMVGLLGKVKVWYYRLGLSRGLQGARYTDLKITDAGLPYEATDWKVTWRWTGTTWEYASGVLEATLADMPTGLTAADAGLLWALTTGTAAVDYFHTLRWTGSAWEVAPTEHLGGYFQDYLKPPTEPGWLLADGAATKYLDILADKTVTPASPTVLNLPNAAAVGQSVIITGATGAWDGLNATFVVSARTATTITIPFDSHLLSSPITGSPLIEVNIVLPDLTLGISRVGGSGSDAAPWWENPTPAAPTSWWKVAQTSDHNLLGMSEDFAPGYNGWGEEPDPFWFTITPDDALDPDGNLTADKIENLTKEAAYLWYTFGVVTELDVCFSVWLKAVTGTYKLKIAIAALPDRDIVAYSDELTLTTDWQKFSVWLKPPVVGNRLSAYSLAATIGGSDAAGDDYYEIEVGAFHVWGAQVNLGTAPGTYVKTTGAPIITGWVDSMGGSIAQTPNAPVEGELSVMPFFRQ